MDVTDDFFKAVKGMNYSENYNEVPVRCILITRKNFVVTFMPYHNFGACAVEEII
jgi:hypothetical protein